MSRTKIILVEDDANLGTLMVDFLESNGFDVKLFRDGESGLNGFKSEHFDFCIFDIMLPGIDGFTLAKTIRAENKTVPIIFLTARSMKQDKIDGFNIGVDDYVTKPFDEDELLCRINAIINRYQVMPAMNAAEPIPVGKFFFDQRNQFLSIDDNTRRLTQKECEVLKMLVASRNNIVRRDDILFSIWGDNDYFNGRSLDVFIAKLRKYLSDDPDVQIANIPKVGYVLKCE